MNNFWSDEDMEGLLDCMLDCQTKIEFDRQLSNVARQRECREDAVRRFLWGVATCVRQYPNPLRVTRSGPASYVDVLLVKWASTSQSDSKKMKPDPIYLSRVLRRSEEEVKAFWKEHGPAKGRIPLFPNLETGFEE